MTVPGTRPYRTSQVLTSLSAAGIHAGYDPDSDALVLGLEDAERLAAGEKRWAELRAYLEMTRTAMFAEAAEWKHNSPTRERFEAKGRAAAEVLVKMTELEAGQ